MHTVSEILLHLSLIDDVGPVTIHRLIQQVQDDTHAWLQLYSLTVSDIISRFHISQRTAQKIVTGLADKSLVDAERARAEKYAIRIVTRMDEEYPELLTHIHAAPAVLYIKGAPLKKEAFRFAVVGSRKANAYAQRSIHTLLEPLVSAGWEIVSGGALGADSMAHECVVELHGVTHAVLGSGLLRPYPRSNRSLFEKILSTGGSLISPFPLMVEALPGNFPARNRIISGMSRGCLVVQAARKSGASITAFHALEQGREVFAVPGMIDDPLSEGCHQLIQQGAKLVISASDIAHEFGQHMMHENPMAPEACDPLEQQIIAACRIPMSVEELMELAGCPLDQIQEKLFHMQLAGELKQSACGLWERV